MDQNITNEISEILDRIKRPGVYISHVAGVQIVELLGQSPLGDGAPRSTRPSDFRLPDGFRVPPIGVIEDVDALYVYAKYSYHLLQWNMHAKAWTMRGNWAAGEKDLKVHELRLKVWYQSDRILDPDKEQALSNANYISIDHKINGPTSCYAVDAIASARVTEASEPIYAHVRVS